LHYRSGQKALIISDEKLVLPDRIELFGCNLTLLRDMTASQRVHESGCVSENTSTIFLLMPLTISTWPFIFTYM
jgi:hypothetical protein